MIGRYVVKYSLHNIFMNMHRWIYAYRYALSSIRNCSQKSWCGEVALHSHSRGKVMKPNNLLRLVTKNLGCSAQHIPIEDSFLKERTRKVTHIFFPEVPLWWNVLDEKWFGMNSFSTKAKFHSLFLSRSVEEATWFHCFAAKPYHADQLHCVHKPYNNYIGTSF